MNVAPLPIAPRTEHLLAERAEVALRETISRVVAARCPPRLAAALEYAVFPGGSRLRPRLLLAVASACGDRRPHVADAAAVGVELVHCASLVHDDLPCFDDAALRRGKATLHVMHGEPLALLVGDALIVHAFETVARSGSSEALCVLAEATGAHGGIVAGQAWESESDPPLDEYHRAKTASLFEAAAAMGAIAAEVDAAPWRRFGELVGRAYQAADDLADATRAETELGKSTGRDVALGRPSVVRTYGITSARRRMATLVAAAMDSVPACSGSDIVRAWLRSLSQIARERADT